MAKSAKQYFEELCREAGYSAEQTAALTTLASDAKVSGKLDELIANGTDNYQAQVGRVRALESKINEYGTWYGTADAEYKKMQTELQLAKAQLVANGIDLGSNGNGNQPAIDSSKFITKEDLAAQIQELGMRQGSIAKDVGRIASRHAAKYHEELDMDAVEAAGIELQKKIGRTPTVAEAYQSFIAPREKTSSEAELAQKLKDAREEGARDALSRRGMPAEPVPTESSMLFSRPPADQIPADMNAELLSAWHGSDK
jgi:hypothetical protein